MNVDLPPLPPLSRETDNDAGTVDNMQAGGHFARWGEVAPENRGAGKLGCAGSRWIALDRTGLRWTVLDRTELRNPDRKCHKRVSPPSDICM